MSSIKIIANCQFSGGTSPRPGQKSHSVKLVALQDPKGPNARLFDGGAGICNVDLTRLTKETREKFEEGELIEITLRQLTSEETAAALKNTA